MERRSYVDTARHGSNLRNHLRPWGDGVILFGWRVDAGANYGAYEEEERQ
jgi:hypothetical protein